MKNKTKTDDIFSRSALTSESTDQQTLELTTGKNQIKIYIDQRRIA